MAKYTNLKDLFKAIANAIRGKEESTGEIVADDFPERITAIETQDTTIEDALISGMNFPAEYTNDRVEYISFGAFVGNGNSYNGNTKIVNFENVETVYQYAFYDCIYLTYVSMPNVVRIWDYAFFETKINKLALPKLVKVGDSAFTLTLLRHLDMLGGAGLPYFGISQSAFVNSTLETLIIRNDEEVCSLENINAFEGTPIESGTGYIYVPASMVDKYKANEKWSVYANQIRAIEDYPEITGG